MFKYSITLLLLVAFLAQTFRQVAIVGGYYADNQTYAQNCINKARPKLHCNGKCQLMKKLKQEEKKDQQNPERKNNCRENVLSSKSFFAAVSNIGLSILKAYSHRNSGIPVDRAEAFFHPPGA